MFMCGNTNVLIVTELEIMCS